MRRVILKHENGRWEGKFRLEGEEFISGRDIVLMRRLLSVMFNQYRRDEAMKIRTKAKEQKNE